MGTVRFILGRAGTGKTSRIVEAIADRCHADPLGPPIYWLVPKQATFQAERLLTAKLGGFARVRVVDFGRLGQAVLDSCGDVGMPEVTPAGRRMVIGHLLRAHRDRLAYYGQSAHRSGLTNELDATFGEFERAGLDPDRLGQLVEALDPADDPAAATLRQKLADVHLLLERYVAYIGTDRLDPARRLDRVLAQVEHCPALRGATLFVDDFYDFTAYERKLLAAVAAAVDHTDVAMLVDPDDPAASDFGFPVSDLSVFHRPLRAYRGLRKAMADLTIEPPVALRDVLGRTPDLAELQRSLFARRPAAPGTGATSVERFEAPDLRAEVDAVARRIRQAVASGARYRDVAVLVRSLGDYREIVHASFAEHGIPYFADHRRSAGHHPLLQLVRGCLTVARGGWPHDAVMALAKCGLTSLTDDEADDLENYVLLHRLRGRQAWEQADPWAFGSTLSRRDDGPAAQAVSAELADALRRRLTGPLEPLLAVARGPRPVREIAVALFAVVERFKVREALARWIAEADRADDVERRGEHEQVWAELVALFDQMVDVIGDERMSVGAFLDVLDGGLEGFDLAIAPATVDQVLLGAADRTRTPPVRLAFVLGLAESMFPHVEQDPLVLSDAERRALRHRQVDLDDDTERQLYDERFLAYVALTRASQQLVVSRPLAGADGKALNPSQFWHEVERVCPGAALRPVPRSSAAHPATIGTPRQLVDALMRWVADDAPAGDGVLPALYQWLAQVRPDGSSVDAMRYRAWRALSYHNDARLDPARAARLFPLPLSATVRQLEDANACPFRHFARYGLLLRNRESADVTQIDLHNAYHQVVENLTRDLLARHADWTQLTPEQARELIRTHAAEVGRQLRGELMLSTARNKYLLDHIERTLERAVASLAEQSRRGKYRPWRANVRFGEAGAMPPYEVTTPHHRTVRLHGRIDRIDLNENKRSFTVSDYKLAPASLALDRVYHGLSLQLLTYLLVAQANLQGGEKPVIPAAAFLVGLLSSPRVVTHPDDALSPDDPDFHLRTKPRGLIDERAVGSLDGGGTEGGGHSPVVAAYRKKEGGLGNRHATDVATADEFARLLAHVNRKLGEAADRIVDGDVRVRPYMLARATPCPRCEYRTVCRFEPGTNLYQVLTPMGRTDVLQRVVEGTDDVRE